MKRLVALFMAVTATMSCAVVPPIMTRPASVWKPMGSTAFA